jgi:hypothetical protein
VLHAEFAGNAILSSNESVKEGEHHEKTQRRIIVALTNQKQEERKRFETISKHDPTKLSEEGETP